MSEEEEDELYYENLRKLAYNFENFYDDSYTEEPNEILYTGSSPTIVVTDDLSIFEEDKFIYKKVYYIIKNNLNQIITLHDAFKQIDNQVYENMKNPFLINYYRYNTHRFIEGYDKINDITFELGCGS